MSKHDKLGKRLGIILTRLNTGERLAIGDLAREFGVSERTVQRDFNSRLNYLPMEREGSTYYIEPSLLGRLSNPDIKQMLSNMGVADLVPSLNHIALSEFSHCPYPPVHFELTTSPNQVISKHFKQLLSAINSQVQVSFSYGNQAYTAIKPYQLINQQGHWVLVAMFERKVIVFRLKDIAHIELSDTTFTINDELIKSINLSQTTIHEADPQQEIEALLIVQSVIAHHFKQAGLLPYQHILKEQSNGDLVISTQLQSPLQLLPHFIYWSPNISIISPSSLQTYINYKVAIRNAHSPNTPT